MKGVLRGYLERVCDARQYLVQRVHDPRPVFALDLEAVLLSTHVHPLVVAVVVDDLVPQLLHVEPPDNTLVPVDSVR